LIGEEIRRRRQEKGWTGVQLAEKAGMAPSAISQIETGKRSPHSASVIKLAAALECEVAELYPKPPQAPLPLEPTFEDELTEERLAGWEAAVEEARRLRKGGRAQLAELLVAWQASKQRGELRSARRGYLDETVQLFNQAYDTTHRLADLLFAEGGIPAPDDWEEVRAADRFYGTLIEMMRNAGFQIRERKSEPPEVEEPDAA
jgi:transcriptional regulator with XRE-family HTH domain